ncbi:nitrilase-related carbon-nitrogen hydrolase [Corynebacterium sp.]|uniref:nitrilase-related carbon-nitrogen hydrolase n=1 Tax=Corynebacterium sp. TaxID=1720 RepID=UPI003B3B017B
MSAVSVATVVHPVCRVACVQVAPDIGHPGNTARAVADAVGSASREGATLVVLPELVNSGYHFTGVAEARRLADSIPGEWTEMLSRLAARHRLVIVAGLAERDDDGALRSSSVVIDRGTRAGVFHKAHLWDAEHEVFTPGDQPTLVVDSSVGRVATAVCYDIEFPEMVRVAAEQNADVLAVPVNWPLRTGPDGALPGGWPIEVHKVVAHAADYRIPIAVADRCGAERGGEFTGGSVIVGHDGVPLAGPRISRPARPELLVADLRTTVAGRRLSDHNHALNDRRPDLYPARPDHQT